MLAQAWPIMVAHSPQVTKNVCGRPEVPQVLAHVASKKNVTLFSTVLAFCREVNVCPTNLSSAISRLEVHSDIIDQSIELIIERSDLCCS